MSGFLRKYKVLFVIPLLSLVVVAILFSFIARPVCAHGPHDVATSIAISPNYEKDQTLFTLMSVWWLGSTELFKSTDGGESWQEVVAGLEGHCGLTSIAISPEFEADRTIFVSSRGNGIYKSTDGGLSWYRANNKLDNLDIRSVIISPNYDTDGTVLSTGSRGGLYKSNDGGQRWHPIMGRWSKDIGAVTFFPAHPEADYVLAGDRKKGLLYFSANQGRDWTQIQLPTDGNITALAVSPDYFEDHTYFVGTSEGEIFRTNDGGASPFEVSRLSLNHPHKNITSLAISPNYGQDYSIFASTWGEAVFRSSDGGRTWQNDTTGITTDPQADAYDRPHFYDLGTSKTFAKDGVIFLAGFDGVFKSTDAGHRWLQKEALALNYVTSIDISPNYDKDKTLVFASYHGGAFISYDSGDTWINVYNNNFIFDADATRLYNIAFSPSFPSENALLMSGAGAFYEVSLDETDMIFTEFKAPNTAIPVMAVSPSLTSDNILFLAAHNTRRLFKSTDNGATWTEIWRPEGGRLNLLAISPDFSSDQTLYANVSKKGIYKTTDGGDTWQAVNNGLNHFLEQVQPSTLTISPDYRQDQTVFVGTEKYLFKTSNGGDHWQRLDGLADGKDNYIISLAMSPDYHDDQTMLVSVKGKGLFKSTDGGTSFVEVGQTLLENNHLLRLIKFSPTYAVDKTIYGAANDLFRSTDGGDTWQIVERPRRYEGAEKRDVIRYEGQWEALADDQLGANGVTRSNTPGSRATLNFTGQRVRLIGTQGPDQGIAKVYIDGTLAGQLDQYNSARQLTVCSDTFDSLTYGNHVIEVEVADTKNPDSSGHWIEIDAIEIDPADPYEDRQAQQLTG